MLTQREKVARKVFEEKTSEQILEKKKGKYCNKMARDF